MDRSREAPNVVINRIVLALRRRLPLGGLERAVQRRRVRQLLEGRIRLDVLNGTVDTRSVAVVMCLWNRPQRITDVIEMLSAQLGERPIRLVLWNNQPDDDEHYREAVSGAVLSGRLASIELHSSRANYGGIGRFWAARKLRLTGYEGPMIFLDDDQDVEERFVDDLLARYSPDTIAGVWAFTNDGTYWNRRAAADRESADYVGTGGCILDVSIVDDDDFFTSLPERYRFLEDIWMCHVARERGWRLEKADVPVVFVLDETNQNHTLAYIKDDFYDYLRGSSARAGTTESKRDGHQS